MHRRIALHPERLLALRLEGLELLKLELLYLHLLLELLDLELLELKLELLRTLPWRLPLRRSDCEAGHARARCLGAACQRERSVAPRPERAQALLHACCLWPGALDVREECSSTSLSAASTSKKKG